MLFTFFFKDLLWYPEHYVTIDYYYLHHRHRWIWKRAHFSGRLETIVTESTI